jgi:hypothetical protein
MIVYTLNDRVIEERTCVFFQVKSASIVQIKDPDADYAAHNLPEE